jgi:aminoglycoside 2'-N-acetyltransferase I
MAVVRRSAALSSEETAAVLDVLRDAWRQGAERFTDQDWEHATGGVHFLLEETGEILAHASVVPRELHAGDHRLSTGYVEAVGTRPSHQRRGHGSALMREIGLHIDADYELGALDTGRPDFYERLGWRVWRGPTYVRTGDGPQRTPEEDGLVMVRPTPTTPALDLSASISCEWRPGDVW